MSLWYESLRLVLDDCGPDPIDRVMCILSYLSMPVPRSWWVKAMQTGQVSQSHAQVVRSLGKELDGLVDPGVDIGSDLLVALPFIAVEKQPTLSEYLTEAKKVLAERPDLAQVGKEIDNMMGPQEWSVYILQCRDGSLYTGIAKDVHARLRQHNLGKGGAYTRSRLPVKLVYLEDGLTHSEALVREAGIKRLPRSKKEEIIHKGHPIR